MRAAPLFGAGAPAAESRMRGYPAKRGLKPGLLLACVLTAGLAGCSDIDNMFDSSNDISASEAPQPTAASMAQGAGAAPTAELPPPTASGGGGIAPVATITPVAIDPGS